MVTVYGVGAVETALRKARKGYVLGVASDHPFHSWGCKPFVSGAATMLKLSFGISAAAGHRRSGHIVRKERRERD